MTQPATARQDALARPDAEPVGVTGPGSSRTARRRVTTGTGATLVLAVASVAAAGSAQADEQYTVRSGDTVSHIAARTGTSVSAIARANSLASAARIRIGQTLTIPTGTPSAPAPAAAPARAATHTVVSGDTVGRIAAKHGTTVAAVVAANGLDARAFIRVGQTLTVPGAAGAAPAAAPAAASGGGAAYTVTAGDTVGRIAAKHGTTVAAIVAANGLDARALIRIGQALTIPGAAGAAPAASTPVPASTAAAPTGAYTVVSGDTVSRIAAKHGTTVAAIVAANGLDSRAFVRVGQTLKVPGAAAAAPTTQLVGNTFAGRTYSSAVVASANTNKATLLSMGVPSKDAMRSTVVATARAMGVDPALAQAVAFQESGFNHTAVSPANAIGTMQVIPSSGDWAGDLVGRPLNLLDPNDNVVAGVAILRQLVRTSPDLPSAIAGYYQGASSVKRNGMFADTRRYVASIQTHMTRFR